MKNKSGEVVDWNRTPGKPSFNAQNHQQNQQQGWNEPVDMWGNANILSARANKPWTNETQPTLNPFQNHNSWNNNQQINGSFPINQVPVNNAPLWGSTSSNINHTAMRPIRGPQPNQQQNIPVMDGRNRQFSGWGLEIDSKPEEAFNNIEAVGQNLISSACSIASYTSIKNSKDPSKPESSLSVLNEMLNGLISENAGKDQAELEELIKAIINVNDAWGQRAVDQSTSWDISSINYDDVVTGTSNASQSGGNNQGSTTSLNPSNHGIASNQSQPQSATQQQQQQQRRIKPMSHAISASNSVDSNVWQNEPPNGTGIWEAHYESLGEKNLEWSSAVSVSAQRQLPNQHPSPQIASQVTQQQQTQQHQPGAKASAIGRPMSFNSTSRQSNLGFRNQPPSADSSSWNYLNSTSLWASNQSNMVHNELLNQQQSQAAGGRPINKGSSSNPRSNPPWPPTTNHPPPHNSDLFLGQQQQQQQQGNSNSGNSAVWSSTHNPNPLDNRKFPSSNSNQVPGGAPSSMMLPQDYQNMMQRPPPPATSSQSSSAKTRPPANKSLPQSVNSSVNGPSSMQQSGFFRANVLRQLINLGFSEEEVQNSMVENNMDIERTLNDLRNKSAHIGLDALLNPIMGSNLFSSNSVSPPVVSNHFSSDQESSFVDPFKKVNGISPTDPTGQQQQGSSTSFSALQLREQGIMKNIIHWNQKFSDISIKISQLMSMPSTNPLPVKELTQLRDQSIQQIHVFQIQLKSVRNQMAMLQQRDVELSDRLSEMRLVNSGGPFSSNNWGSGGDVAFGGGWNNPPVSMHGGDEFFDQNHHQSHATNLAPGADRRWNNETVNSNTNLSVTNQSTTNSQQQQQQKNLWPSSSFNNKDDKLITRHIIIKDLPSHITFEMIKMTVVSALSTGLMDASSQQQQLNEEFELNPNMASKWCLISLASPIEAAHLMNQIGNDNMGDGKGLGHPEFITEETTMAYLKEIKNLSMTFGEQAESCMKENKNHHESSQEAVNNQTDLSGSPPNSPSS